MKNEPVEIFKQTLVFMYEFFRFLKNLVFQDGPRTSSRLLSANTFLRLINPNLRALLDETRQHFSSETSDLIHEGDEVQFRLKCENHFQARELVGGETLLLGHEFTNSIGHMGLGLATHIRLHHHFSDLQFNKIVVYDKCANNHLLETYFSNYFTLIKLNGFVYQLVRFYLARLFEEVAYTSTKSGPVELYQAQSMLAAQLSVVKNDPQTSLTCLFDLTESDHEYLKHLLLSLNLDPDKEFVILHLKRDESKEGLRGVTFRNYIPTIEHIISTGRYVVFLGDDREGIEHLANFEGFIDYQNTSYRSGRSDIVLFGGCRLAIVSTSGPMNIPGLFGRPILWTNAIGFSQYLFHYNAYFIPKLFYENGELVSLDRMLSEPELFFVDSLSEIAIREYQTRDIQLVENKPVDILHAYLEIEHVSETWLDSSRCFGFKAYRGKYISRLAKSFDETYPGWAN